MENYHKEKYQIRMVRNLFIPMRDGATLAADLYRPDADGAFPALLSFYPYHKDDLIGAMNEFPRRISPVAVTRSAHRFSRTRQLRRNRHQAMDRAEGRDGAKQSNG